MDRFAEHDAFPTKLVAVTEYRPESLVIAEFMNIVEWSGSSQRILVLSDSNSGDHPLNHFTCGIGFPVTLHSIRTDLYAIPVVSFNRKVNIGGSETTKNRI